MSATISYLVMSLFVSLIFIILGIIKDMYEKLVKINMG